MGLVWNYLQATPSVDPLLPPDVPPELLGSPLVDPGGGLCTRVTMGSHCLDCSEVLLGELILHVQFRP